MSGLFHWPLFDKNIEALKTHHPSILTDIEIPLAELRAHPDRVHDSKVLRLIDAPRKTKNLVYSHTPSAPTLTYYNPDGLTESDVVIEKANVKSPQLVLHFGIGLGYLFKAFQSRRTKATFAQFVCEKDIGIFLRALHVHDFTQDFADQDIVWCIGKQPGYVIANMTSFFESNSTVNRNFRILVTPGALATEQEYYSQVMRAIITCRDEATIWSGNSVSDSFTGLWNTLHNLEFLSTNPGIVGLKDKFAGQTCVSVAAGPSLNEAWETLKRIQGKVPIIACDTLVKPMNERGIVPDFVTALERDPIVAEMFRGHPISERTTLIGPSLLLPDSIHSFQGRKLIYAASASYSRNVGLDYLGVMAPGSSAGNLNIALATFFGFKNIILIGHNLAFAHGSNESHVKGTIEPERERKKTEEEIARIASGGKVATQDGTSEVYTIFEYNLFKKQIEACVAANSDRRFINTAAKGNKILGTEYLPLEQALNECHHKDFDCYPVLQHALETAEQKFGPAPWRAHTIRHRLKEISQKLGDLIQESIAMEASVEQWAEDIQNAEDAGRPWSLQDLNKRLDQVLELKVKVVNREMSLNNGLIGVVGPAHNVFERTINELPYLHTTDYDLKKDFLLKHAMYFKIWNKWLEPIYDEHRLAYERMLAVIPEDPQWSWEACQNKLRAYGMDILGLCPMSVSQNHSARTPASDTDETKSLSMS